MQGGNEGEAELQHNTSLEDIDESPPSTIEQENEIDMQEGVTGVKKRGQAECVENPCNGKLRRREGIKRGLQDITPVSYEEYNTSWDLEDQSKKCRRAVNCLLASYKCKAECEPISNESGDMPVHAVHDDVAELSRRADTRDADRAVQPALLYALVSVILAGTATLLRG